MLMLSHQVHVYVAHHFSCCSDAVSSCISCYTFRLVWKKSCKHREQPSALHKAPFGRFRLVANLTCLRRPWAPTQTISALNHCDTQWAVLLLVWSGGDGGVQGIMRIHVWMHAESPDEWRHLQGRMVLTYGVVWCVTDCVWWLLQMLRSFLEHDF